MDHTTYKPNGYRIVSRKAANLGEENQAENKERQTSGKGGVSIVYNKNSENQIYNINRQSGRIITVGMETEIMGRYLEIIRSYAPHVGYGSHIIGAYWGDIKTLMGNKTKNQCTVWATGNNGQIHSDHHGDEWDAIGQWTYQQKIEWEMGEITKYCNKYQRSATNTFRGKIRIKNIS